MDNSIQTQPVPANTQTSAQVFPSFSVLFSETWHLFISRFSRFFLSLLIVILGYALSFGITVFTFSGAIISIFLVHEKTATPFIMLIVGGLIFSFILIFLCSFLSSIWFILSLSEAQTESFGSIMKKGFSLILPVFGISFLTFFLEVGGLIFLLIPFILFLFFFSFAQFEVIAGGQSPLHALKRSYMITTHNFAAVFIRLFILFILSVALTIIPQIITLFNSKVSMEVGVLSFIINLIFEWYALCFSYTVYTQAKQRTDFNKSVSFVWIWIIAAIGWVIWTFIFLSLGSALYQFARSGELEKIIQSYEKQNKMTPTQNSANPAYVLPSQTPSNAAPNNSYTYPSAAPTGSYQLQSSPQQRYNPNVKTQ